MRLINQIHPRALDTAQWPSVLASALPDAARQRFETLKGALDDYLRGAKPAEIKASYGVSRAWLNKKLHDCLDTGEDGRIQGYRGLLKHAARKEYVRVSRVRRPEHEDGRGTAGAFGKLLRDYPFIKKMVTKAMGGRNGTSIKEAGLNVRALHKQILDWLKQKGAGADEYPFNTASNGYFGLCRYITSRLLAGERAVALAKFGEASQSGLMAGTGKVSWLRANRPLSIVCYDEQALPLIGTLVIEMDGQEIEVPMERCSLCLFADEASQAILGYFISMRRRINTSDMLRALEHVLTPWQPRELAIEGMRYGEGAGLPAGFVQGYLGSRICLLRMDNDPVHYANAMIDYAAERTGMIIQFGQPGRWIARIVVERVFSQLQLRFLGRVPSTTGSGPSDLLTVV